jgi:glycosyltransferase involved in cell wall biosynthesis
MMKRILFIINQFYRGGAENSLLAMLKLLPSDKYDIYLAIYDQSRKGAGLVSKVPKHIHLCVEHKYFFLLNYAPKYSQKILRFVSSTCFDLAISFGEWMSPQLLVSYATAKKKIIWLHNDVSLINTPYASDLFSYDSFIDQYVCVSKLQAEITANAFPFLEKKCSYVHNPLLEDEILEESEKECPDFAKEGEKIIVSIGNLRPQKNYLRAVKAAKLLKDIGISFRWLIIGALDDKDHVRQIRDKIKEYQLDENIFLLGSKINPWCYLRCADVLVSSSDFESWGMVFAEARVLAIPVVATKTTGACEQIEDRKSGLLSEFSENSLAMCIKEILEDSNIRGYIKRNILSKPKNFDFLAEFSQLLKYKESNRFNYDCSLYYF